jgi:hypothetical protein
MPRLFIGTAIVSIAIVSSTSGFSMSNREYLEQYDLSELKYVRKGSLECEDGKVNEGSVSDPQGFFHHVRTGQTIGKHFGVIQEISKDRMVVFEALVNEKHEWIPRRVFMRSQDAHFPDTPAHIYQKLDTLDPSEWTGKREPTLSERLMKCWTGQGDDAKRLACYDEIVSRI